MPHRPTPPSKRTPRRAVSDRTLATVLAALRWFQHDENAEEVMRDAGFFDDHDPLTAEEIDTLCERWNT